MFRLLFILLFAAIVANAQEPVDLGLSVKWASCNVGAKTRLDYGGHYAWGETETKKEYTLETLSDKLNQNPNCISTTLFDAAAQEFGKDWRMPTAHEMMELVEKCKWEWLCNDSIVGYKVTGKNGNYILLPAAGAKEKTASPGYRMAGCYASAEKSVNNPKDIYYLYFGVTERALMEYGQERGYSIRPVYNDYEGKRSLESNAIHTGKEHKYERDFYKLEKTQRNLNHRLEIKKEFPKTKENQSFTYY